ncbi:hypothetical protein EYF80_003993 [Liparis tanakae]|uniref:Uncharacterized protein n=1 Tax=Liparis tanakae TaxID=230148 RepID=A0A4Z2J6D9_9TELE|nr:hypothetical protein EYF80_003993 [Liparis tanakae]
MGGLGGHRGPWGRAGAPLDCFVCSELDGPLQSTPLDIRLTVVMDVAGRVGRRRRGRSCIDVTLTGRVDGRSFSSRLTAHMSKLRGEIFNLSVEKKEKRPAARGEGVTRSLARDGWRREAGSASTRYIIIHLLLYPKLPASEPQTQQDTFSIQPKAAWLSDADTKPGQRGNIQKLL